MEIVERAGYTVLGLIGTGAAGSVYKARSPGGKVVAVKVLPSCDAEARRRLRREFDAVRALNHPHAARYLDIGAVDDQPYLVLEFVEGISLWRLVQGNGPLPEREVLHLSAQIGSALDAAHELNILHLDVKPTNILLTPSADAKLIDFKLAKGFDAEQALSDRRTALETLFYMAPEQFFEGRNVDSRTDVYGLAATLFFALTGKVPFKFSGANILEKKLQGQFQRPGDELGTVSPGLIWALRKGLTAEPERRPNSGVDLLFLLRSVPRLTPRPERREARPTHRPCNFQGSAASTRGAQEFPVQVVAISADELCLVASQAFAPLAVLDVTFHFKDSGESWCAQARVVHAREWEAQQWRHSCRFVNPVDRAEVLALLNEKRDNVQVRVCGLT
jgi:serine/threonine protein kinase